jgi:hypothetical protein
MTPKPYLAIADHAMKKFATSKHFTAFSSAYQSKGTHNII